MNVLVYSLISVIVILTVQSQECGREMQICAPISSLPPGIQHPAEHRLSDVIQLRKELDKAVKQLDQIATRDPKTQKCPLSSYTFPRRFQMVDHARYRRYVSRLTSATACMWVNAMDLTHDVALLSYAVSSRMWNNFLILYRASDSHMKFFVGRGNVAMPFNLQSGVMTHVCAWFDSSTRKLGIYMNGVSTQNHTYAGSVVSGGGSLVLGQEQDGIATGFERDQSMTGTVKNAMLWPRVLSSSEILAIAQDCVCPIDHVVAMTIDKMELYGQTTYSIPETCPVIR